MRLILFLMCFNCVVFAQQDEQKLAYQHFINGQYLEAINIYEDLNKEKFLIRHYVPYFTSLLKLEEYKKAGQLARKASDIYPTTLSYQLDIGVIEEKKGNRKKAEKIYDQVFKKIKGSNKNSYINLANTFTRYTMFERALDLYEFAQQKNSQLNFSLQKAQIYSNLGKSELMVTEYLAELNLNPNQKTMVISQLQRFLDNDGIKSDKNYSLVKKALLVEIRNNPERIDFMELLIWLFMQNHQFEMALKQAKALDKRTSAGLEKIFDLGDSFLDKEYYQLAIDAYDYVIQRVTDQDVIIHANINKLYAQTKLLLDNDQDINELDNAYKEIINQLGEKYNTVILLSNYAHFKAFYLNDLVAAENILIRTMGISGITDIDLAECKLEYADIQLLLGNIWESLLYYSQVEKDFKENPLGHEAKLRRAKIAYYQGDFLWAQAQLSTLKASTSKLIANDAMELSLLITDNYNLDTSDIAMQTFARADLLNYQKRKQDALVKYDSILFLFPGHSLSDEIYMRKAEIYIELDDYQEALVMYDKIILEHSYDILVDDALYRKAQIYHKKLQEKSKAMDIYERILLEHNSSIFVAESRKKFRELRGDKLEE